MWSRLPSGRLIAGVAFVALAVSTVALAAPADAAGATAVRLDAGTERIDVGERTTVDVVVSDTNGGVGAYNVTVSVDADTVAVADAAVDGDADLTRVDVADDGSAVTLVVALADTADAGPQTIASVTVEAVAPGTTGVGLTVTELADEAGRTYGVTEATGTELTVVSSVSPATTADATGSAADPVSVTPSSTAELDGPADTVVAVTGGWRAPATLLLAGAAFLIVFGAFARRR